MKKFLVVILLIYFALSIFMFIMINEKLDSIQTNYDNLSHKVDEYIIAVAPLSAAEVETFQHNIEVLNAFYGVPSSRPIEIANQCFSLKRNGKMDSAWIVDIIEHNNPAKNYYCIEIITEDEEHYWFTFDYDSSFIYMIQKGANKETLLFGIVE